MNENDIVIRVKSAMVMLNAGISFRAGGLSFSAKVEHHLIVTGKTTLYWLENITKRSALSDLRSCLKLKIKQMSLRGSAKQSSVLYLVLMNL